MTMTPENPVSGFSDQYVTEAAESGVLSRTGETIGHVGLLDLDETSLRAAEEVARQTPGVSVVLRTSEQSYHVWALAVRELDEWTEHSLALGEPDVEHVALSNSRECSVLRVDAKRDVETGERIKPAPRVLRVVETPTPLPQSDPHARVLSSLTDAEIDNSGEEWLGHSLDRRVYMADIGGR
jgi:hypothetical protein